LREQLLAEGLVLLAALEEPRHRLQLDRRQRDEVIRPDEDVELGRVQALDRPVVDREVEDGEELAVVDVVVALPPLALREDVLDVERMPAEAPGKHPGCQRVGRVEMDPGETGGAELSGCARVRGDVRDLAAAWATDAREARHRYSGGPRSRLSPACSSFYPPSLAVLRREGPLEARVELLAPLPATARVRAVRRPQAERAQLVGELQRRVAPDPVRVGRAGRDEEAHAGRAQPGRFVLDEQGRVVGGEERRGGVPERAVAERAEV